MDQILDLSTRIPGCQSTNHTECWGELWTCAACQKVTCYQEGSDHDPDLCDDCWAAKHCPGASESSQAGAAQSSLYLDNFVSEVLQEFGQAGIVAVPVWREKKSRAWWWPITRMLRLLKGEPSHV